MARYKEVERIEARSFARQKFITAAIKEFAREGYENANINRISQVAGYAKGTIYNHFLNKQSLLLEIIKLLGQDHLAYIAEQVFQETHPKPRLERFFTAGFQYVETHPDEAQLLVQTLYSPNTEFREPLGEAYLPMFQLISQEILRPGVAEGTFRKVDLPQYASLLMTLYLGTCSQVDANGKPLVDPNSVAEFAFQALRGTETDSSF